MKLGFAALTHTSLRGDKATLDHIRMILTSGEVRSWLYLDVLITLYS